MQEAQMLVTNEDLAVYDKVSSKIFAGGLPKVTMLFGATHISRRAKFTLAQLTAKK